LFVAEFIGSPSMNVAEADLAESNGSVCVRFGEAAELAVPPEVLSSRPALGEYRGRKIVVGVRPEDIEDAAFADGDLEGRTLTATLDIREDMGSEVYGHFPVQAKPVLIQEVKEALGAEAVEAEAEQARRGQHRFI